LVFAFIDNPDEGPVAPHLIATCPCHAQPQGGKDTRSDKYGRGLNPSSNVLVSHHSSQKPIGCSDPGPGGPMEEKLAQADHDGRNRKRLMSAAEQWLFLARQVRRLEVILADEEAAPRRRPGLA
jgi:hypothetical protein